MNTILDEEARIISERSTEVDSLEAEILERPIHSLPSLRPAVEVEPRASVRSVVDRLNQERIGCVLVVDSGTLVGVFTERDVLSKVAGQPIDIDRVAVEALMTPEPECLTPEDGIAYALNKMAVGGFRHIPLVDARGQPRGIVAMRDIVEYLVDLFPRGVLNLPPSPDLAIARTREGA
jgi:CBS domain-containing protein